MPKSTPDTTADDAPEAVALPETNYFEVLAQIAPETDKKARLTYVSWAEAWNRLKRVFPDADFFFHETDTVLHDQEGNPMQGPETYLFTAPNFIGGFVKVTVTVAGISHTMPLPVMDQRNNAVPADKIDAMAINKALLRALTKCIAMHGLGLHVYKGEDLPDEMSETQTTAPAKPKKANPSTARIRKASEGKDREKVAALYKEMGGGKPDTDVDALVKAIEALPSV